MDRVECYRAASVAFDRWVCGGADGRAKTEPVYQIIVEGRDVPATYKTYSSCGDRPHAKLWRFGCEKPFINREERTPLPKDWEWGVNISRLHNLKLGAPCLSVVSSKGERYPVAPGASWEPAPGDELLTWTTGLDAHSLSIVSFDGDQAETANYGASGMSAAVFPGAQIATHRLEFRGGKWWYGEGARRKQVMRVLRLVDYIEVLTRKANLEGIPFDDDYIGEVRDRIEAER